MHVSSNTNSNRLYTFILHVQYTVMMAGISALLPHNIQTICLKTFKKKWPRTFEWRVNCYRIKILQFYLRLKVTTLIEWKKKCYGLKHSLVVTRPTATFKLVDNFMSFKQFFSFFFCYFIKTTWVKKCSCLEKETI